MDLNEIVAWQYVNLGGQVYYLREDVFPFLTQVKLELERKFRDEAALREKLAACDVTASRLRARLGNERDTNATYRAGFGQLTNAIDGLREKMSGQKILAEEAFNNLEKYYRLRTKEDASTIMGLRAELRRVNKEGEDYRLRTKEDASTIDGLRAKVLEQGNLIGSLQTELKRVKKEGDEQLKLAGEETADLKFDLGRMQEEKDFLSSTTNERSREKEDWRWKALILQQQVNDKEQRWEEGQALVKKYREKIERQAAEITRLEKRHFDDHCDRVAQQVEAWPAWKRDVLGCVFSKRGANND